jgi:hypothetical protein
MPIAFFALLGFIFLMTQYFQVVRAYSPLATGVRLLPVAVSVGVASVSVTRLAVRVGNKIIVGCGMALFCAALAWIASTASQTTSYGLTAAQMVMLGVGMGFTQAPATEAIMGAVPKQAEKAGARLTDKPHDRPWGIYSGYFRDLDGHLREIMWNPSLTRRPINRACLPVLPAVLARPRPVRGPTGNRCRCRGGRCCGCTVGGGVPGGRPGHG